MPVFPVGNSFNISSLFHGQVCRIMSACRDEDVYKLALQLEAMKAKDGADILISKTQDTFQPFDEPYTAANDALYTNGFGNSFDCYAIQDTPHCSFQKAVYGSSNSRDPVFELGYGSNGRYPGVYNSERSCSSVSSTSSQSCSRVESRSPQSFTGLNGNEEDEFGRSSVSPPSHFYPNQNVDFKTRIFGPGLETAVRGRTSTFFILTSKVLSKMFSFKVRVLDPNDYPCTVKLKQVSATKISVRYKPDFLGLHKISVHVNDIPAEGSPLTVESVSEHRYESSGTIKYAFDGDPQQTFKFSKPWGICCNLRGFIFVGDRGHHTIRVFSPNFAYSHAIGTEGSNPGELNKPAGLAVNSLDQLVVADKDNHRIQIFSFQGSVITVFGDQIHYPWGVAIGPNDSVLVTDRNKRISMFSMDGTFIRYFGNDSSKMLDSPRGIYYRELDHRIIIADMNKHQIIVMETQETIGGESSPMKEIHPSRIGRPGHNPNELSRPQGLTCDSEGNIIVSDNKNGRMQVFDGDGNYLSHWDIETPKQECQAKPMDVCVTPSGSVLVVDFEYKRVLVY